MAKERAKGQAKEREKVQAKELSKPEPQTPMNPSATNVKGHPCTQTPCPHKHVCRICEGPHQMKDCPQRQGA